MKCREASYADLALFGFFTSFRMTGKGLTDKGMSRDSKKRTGSLFWGIGVIPNEAWRSEGPISF